MFTVRHKNVRHPTVGIVSSTNGDFDVMVFVVHCPQLLPSPRISSFPLAAVKEKPDIASRYKHVTLEEGEMQWGRAEMEQFYKGYRIEVSVTLDGNAWTVGIFIYYSEGLRNILVPFQMNQEFKTYDDAMEAGLAAAKKWIDERPTS